MIKIAYKPAIITVFSKLYVFFLIKNANIKSNIPNSKILKYIILTFFFIYSPTILH